MKKYLYMEQNNLLLNKLYMIDCTNLNKEEQTNKVKQLITKLQ